MKKLLFFIGIAWVFCVAFGQQPQQNVFEALEESDSETGAKVVVYQDDRIANLFRQRTAVQSRILYRVQVFSSNNQQTAKSQAYNIEKTLKEQFPDQNVQVNFLSPFWKVRIGEFATRSDAQSLKDKIVGALPTMQNQIYVITDRSKMNN